MRETIENLIRRKGRTRTTRFYPRKSKWNGGGMVAGTGYETPSYDNVGGTGDRLLQIYLTISTGLWTGGGGSWTNLLDGLMADVAYPGNGVAVAGEYLLFDFIAPVVINEFKLYGSTTVANCGVWRVKASNDKTNWTILSADFTLSLASGATVYNQISTNTTAYRYYELEGVSGTSVYDSYWREFEFKIGNQELAAMATPTVYNLSNGLSAWQTRRSQNKAVFLVSNSVGAGSGATTPATTGWFAKLLSQLKTTYGDGGTFVGFWNDLVSVDESSLWTLGAGWIGTDSLHDGIGNTAGAGAAEITLTGRYFDIYGWAGGSYKAYTATFDEGAPDAISSDTGVFRHTVNTFDKGQASHTISLARGSGWAGCNGIAARTGTGLFGINSSETGAVLGAPGTLATVPYLGQLGNLDPALMIISYGINEFRTDVDPAVFQAQLAGWVVYAKAFSDCSILITTQNPVNEIQTYEQTLYNDACFAVARKYGCAFVDIHQLMGGTYAAALANGYMGADAIHPPQGGHDFYYSSVLAALA